jgi:hypothetical protein
VNNKEKLERIETKLAAGGAAAGGLIHRIPGPRGAVPGGHKRKANVAKHNGKKNPITGMGNGRLRSFSFAAPGAASVQLVGDFTQWQQKPINMHKGADGVWSTAVELPPGSHPYRFLVDGEWHDDPQCTRYVPNPYGGQNAVCEVA